MTNSKNVESKNVDMNLLSVELLGKPLNDSCENITVSLELDLEVQKTKKIKYQKKRLTFNIDLKGIYFLYALIAIAVLLTIYRLF